MSDRPERAIRILLADASRITTMGIRQVIEKESDMEIVGVASDGEEALEAAKRSKPTVIISDVVMPGMDGYELCRNVKDNPGLSDVPVILSTMKDSNRVEFFSKSRKSG